MAGRSHGITVTSRVLSILRTFDTAHRRQSLTEIAERADLPIATAHRLIAELTAGGLLERDGHGTYEIGRRMWDLGLLASMEHDLRETALPYLQDVHTSTGETVHLAVLDDDAALYIERVSSRVSARVLSKPGVRLPLHATAVGKVLLAHSAPDLQDRILAAPARLTGRTITEPGRWRRELSEVRRRGYARTSEELTTGAFSVAVPVMTGPDVVAAIGIVTGSARKDLDRYVPVLQVAASGLARSLPPDAALPGFR
jgi:DNA-binding IclR family transcriptional regulator